MNPMKPDDFYAQMEYPVEFQAKNPLARDWETIYVARNADEMQFKINSYDTSARCKKDTKPASRPSKTPASSV